MCRSPSVLVGTPCGGNTSASCLGSGRPTRWGSPRRRGASGQGGGSCLGQVLFCRADAKSEARVELLWTDGGEELGSPGPSPSARHRKTPTFKGHRLCGHRVSTWPGPGADWHSPVVTDEERSPERGSDLPRATQQSGDHALVCTCKAHTLHSSSAAQRPQEGSGRDRGLGTGLAQPRLALWPWPRSPQTVSPGRRGEGLALALLPTNWDRTVTYKWTPAGVLTPRGETVVWEEPGFVF